MIIPVKTTTGGYNITLERGAHTFADKYFKLDRKVLIVTDDGVPAEYAKTVAASCRTPFIITLHAPQWPVPQASFVPLRHFTLRRYFKSVVLFSYSVVISCPLRTNETMDIYIRPFLFKLFLCYH